MLSNLINNFKNKNREFYHSYFYKYLIFKSYLRNLNLNFFFLKKKLNKLNNFDRKKFIFKKEVLIVTHSLSRGGAERQVVKLANLLLKKKYSVKLLLTNYNYFNKPNNSYILDLNKKIKIYYLEKPNNEFSKLNFDSELKKNLSFLNSDDLYTVQSLIKFFKTKNINLVHSFLDDTNIVVGLAAKISGTPKIILSLRNAAPWRWTFYKSYWKECYKFFLKQKNFILVCNSQNNSRDYEKWLKIKRKVIKTTYNIFDFDKGQKSRKKLYNKKIIFGIIARLAPEKNLFYLLKIFKEFKSKNIYLKILGKGYLLNRLKKYTHKVKINDKVSFLSETNNVKNFMSKLDVFILTSYMEGIPNVLLEAQNQGLPIFSTRVGGIDECVVENYTCTFIPKDSPKLASKKILDKIKDKNFFEKKDFNKIKFKLNNFKSKNVLKTIEKIYKSKI